MKSAGRVVDNGDGTQHVDLSNLLTTLIVAAILAGGTALVTVGVLVFRAEAAEGDIEAIEEDVSRQGRNQILLDAQQRRIGQDSEHANLKLDALLEAMEVTKRIPHPPLPASELEKPKPSE
ncbi:MAG: hypothetical protein GY898_11220 [Proteobacteria bacterium]|nr:hypothetical protein [Pseudomonadota bacterium]